MELKEKMPQKAAVRSGVQLHAKPQLLQNSAQTDMKILRSLQERPVPNSRFAACSDATVFQSSTVRNLSESRNLRVFSPPRTLKPASGWCQPLHQELGRRHR